MQIHLRKTFCGIVSVKIVLCCRGQNPEYSAASMSFLVGGGLTILIFKYERALSWLNSFWRRTDVDPSRPFRPPDSTFGDPPIALS